MYCHRTGVPMDIRGKIRELIVASGPLMCSQYNSAWKKKFPEVQFNYQEWGFERLQACFESMPQLVVITKDDSKTWVSLTGGVQPTVGGGGVANNNGVQGAVMSRGNMSGIVGGVIASKVPNVDMDKVKAFMSQPKLEFTIDCLIEEFAKFSTSPGIKGGAPVVEKQKKRAPRQNRGRPGANGAPAGGD